MLQRPGRALRRAAVAVDRRCALVACAMPPAPRRAARAALRRAGVGARRPGRADVQQPHRVPRGLPRLRLDRRGGGADQHRLDGAADRILPGRQRRAAAGDRGRPASNGCATRGPRRARRCEAIWVVGAAAADWQPPRRRCRAVPLPADGGGDARRPTCSPATRWRSSTPPARPARPKGVICPHAQFYWLGREQRRASSASRPTTCCARRCRSSTSTRSTPSRRRRSRGARGRASSRASPPRASGRRCAAADATVVYLLGAMVPILLAQPAGEAERAHRVRVGLGPGVPAAAGAGVPGAHRRRA